LASKIFSAALFMISQNTLILKITLDLFAFFYSQNSLKFNNFNRISSDVIYKSLFYGLSGIYYIFKINFVSTLISDYS